MEILSFIEKKGTYFAEMSDQVSLDPEQLVLEVLEIMLNQDFEYLAIRENHKCVGIVYFRDLIYFLTFKSKINQLLFHKLNFNLRSAITAIQALKTNKSVAMYECLVQIKRT